ncbi:alpha/beta fold hydrolase [Dactylosporangium sp. NPDC051484]|uniref:alpha/beta fold hydrolase n=1 Tax=Dactylosporangium sp. NPDC051484 TaxID=3154942 RepID=UPI0034507F6F
MLTRFVNAGLVFDVDDLGDSGAPGVVLLHGFPQDRTAWAGVAPVLVAEGLRVLAPDLRGYSPGASPRDRRQYTLDLLTTDVLALADQAGLARFDLVGHDWGAALAFHVAGTFPDRVRTLTALSVPHRGAWAQAALRGTQLWHSAYIGFFQLPRLPERVLARGIAGRLRRSGLDEQHARRYAERGARGGLDAALNWYRAMTLPGGKRFPRVTVPTLYAWGDRDEFVTERLARLCGGWVDGEYTFEILRGVNHWIPELHPSRAAELVLSRRR